MTAHSTDNRQFLRSNDDLVAQAPCWKGVIAFDTEFIRTNTFYAIPGLYQLAGNGFSHLIDPLGIDRWGPFEDLLRGDQVIVMHSCSEDIELLNSHLALCPAGLFDTQVAYAFVSQTYSASYATLVEEFFDTALDKGATRSNWLQRPLSDSQVHYAHLDVAYLNGLYEQLSEQLAMAGRTEWCYEEMAKRCRYKNPDPLVYYTTVSGAWRLDQAQLGALRGLCSWREAKARSEDVPRNKVVGDDQLLAFAQLSQISQRDLHAQLPAAICKRYGGELLQTHSAGQDDRAGLQVLPKPFTSTENKLIKQLRVRARERAEQLGMAPELLARKREVEAYARLAFDAPTELHNFADWRAEVVGDDFLAIMADQSLASSSDAR